MISYSCQSPTLYVAHNGVDVFCPGTAEEGQVIATGQPFLEVFNTLEELNARLAALGAPPFQDGPPAEETPSTPAQ